MEYKLNDLVECQWNGNWYNAKIISAIQEDGKRFYRVHYMYWDRTFDEKFSAEEAAKRIRKRDQESVKPEEPHNELAAKEREAFKKLSKDQPAEPQIKKRKALKDSSIEPASEKPPSNKFSTKPESLISSTSKTVKRLKSDFENAVSGVDLNETTGEEEVTSEVFYPYLIVK